MPSAKPYQYDKLNREIARRELAAEQVRMRHYRKAAACVQDDALRERWKLALETSRGRAAMLAIALADMGENVPVAAEYSDSMRCLLDAMDMALRNGDQQAAETVVDECMTLVDARCQHICNEQEVQ